MSRAFVARTSIQVDFKSDVLQSGEYGQFTHHQELDLELAYLDAIFGDKKSELNKLLQSRPFLEILPELNDTGFPGITAIRNQIKLCAAQYNAVGTGVTIDVDRIPNHPSCVRFEYLNGSCEAIYNYSMSSDLTPPSGQLQGEFHLCLRFNKPFQTGSSRTTN